MEERDTEYVNQLKKLVLQIQTTVSRLDTRTRELLVNATKWTCPDKTEKRLLNDLINRALEYIELERIVKEQKGSKDDTEKYFSYSRWFSSMKMLLDTFDVPLRSVSFSDLTLKE